MKVYGEIEEAQLQNLATDPTANVAGQFHMNTTSKFMKYNDGSGKRRVIDDATIGHFGTPNVDGTWPNGTWRISIDSGKLAFEKMELTVWVKHFEMGE